MMTNSTFYNVNEKNFITLIKPLMESSFIEVTDSFK